MVVPASERKIKSRRKLFSVTTLLITLLMIALLIVACDDSERRRAYVDANPGLDEFTRNAVLEGKIFVGMSEEALLASWGKPNRVNRSVSATGVTEQWVYGIDPPWDYVYVRDGKVTGWQVSRTK